MLSKRIRDMTPSATVELNSLIAELAAQGKSIIKLNIGEPDFDTPAPAVAACRNALAAGETRYTSVAGIAPLRAAIRDKLEDENGVRYTPEEIIVSTGAKQALYNAVMAVCDPGDEVIIPRPCWVSYVEIVRLAQGRPVLVDTCPGDFSLDMEAIEAAVTPRTKAVILNTPNNPTGAVYPASTLAQLGELAVRHGLFVISDEIYEKLTYDGHAHTCIASLSPEIRARCIVINGMSKAYAMTGWRVGYSAAPAEVTRGMIAFQGHTTTNCTTFAQYGALEALRTCSGFIADMRGEFARRRAYMLERLQKIPGIPCAAPAGAFYLMPDISGYYDKQGPDGPIGDAQGLCTFLLRHAGVTVLPGSAFFAPRNIRLSYSNSMDNLKAGMDALEQALRRLT